MKKIIIILMMLIMYCGDVIGQDECLSEDELNEILNELGDYEGVDKDITGAGESFYRGDIIEDGENCYKIIGPYFEQWYPVSCYQNEDESEFNMGVMTSSFRLGTGNWSVYGDGHYNYKGIGQSIEGIEIGRLAIINEGQAYEDCNQQTGCVDYIGETCAYVDGEILDVYYVLKIEDGDLCEIEEDEEDSEVEISEPILDCWLDWSIECDGYTATLCDHNFSELLSCYLSRFEDTQLFALSTFYDEIPESGDSVWTLDAGQYGEQELDFSNIQPNLSILKYVLLIAGSFVAAKIVTRPNNEE